MISAIPVVATDWKLFIHTSLNPKQYKQQSLTIAYYQVCQTARFMGLDRFVMLEDDLQITDRDGFIDRMIYREEFDLCYLTRTRHNQEGAKTSPHNDLFDKVNSNWWETPATLWSAKFAERFIDHIEAKTNEGLWLGHIDHELDKLNQTGEFMFLGSTKQVAIGLSSTEQTVIPTEGSIYLDTL
jgi:hypothetical protein